MPFLFLSLCPKKRVCGVVQDDSRLLLVVWSAPLRICGELFLCLEHRLDA